MVSKKAQQIKVSLKEIRENEPVRWLVPGTKQFQISACENPNKLLADATADSKASQLETQEQAKDSRLITKVLIAAACFPLLQAALTYTYQYLTALMAVATDQSQSLTALLSFAVAISFTDMDIKAISQSRKGWTENLKNLMILTLGPGLLFHLLSVVILPPYAHLIELYSWGRHSDQSIPSFLNALNNANHLYMLLLFLPLAFSCCLTGISSRAVKKRVMEMLNRPVESALVFTSKSILFLASFTIITPLFGLSSLYLQELLNIANSAAQGKHTLPICLAILASVLIAATARGQKLKQLNSSPRKDQKLLLTLRKAPVWRKPLILSTVPGLAAIALFFINTNFLVQFFSRLSGPEFEFRIFLYSCLAFLPALLTYRLLKRDPERDEKYFVFDDGIAAGYSAGSAGFFSWDQIESVRLQRLATVSAENCSADDMNQHELAFASKNSKDEIRICLKTLSQFERGQVAEIIKEKLSETLFDSSCRKFILDPQQFRSKNFAITGSGVSGSGKQISWVDLTEIGIARMPGLRDEDYHEEDLKQHELVLIDRFQRQINFPISKLDSRKSKDLSSYLNLVESKQQIKKDIRAAAALSQLGIGSQEAVQNEEPGITELWESELKTQIQRTNYVPLERDDLLQKGQYRIIRHLRSGGFSTTYLAQDEKSQSRVVLKESALPAGLSPEAINKLSELFAREARLIQRCNHQRILRIIDFFHENKREYLVLEQIDGTPLSVLKPEAGGFSIEQVISWGLEMAGFLEHLHELDPPIIHRDFTPDNMLLHSSGSLYLIDFGAANEFIGNATGTLIGKQSYIAPEQFQGKAVLQSDIYSLCGSLHYLLTGKDPVPLSRSNPKKLNKLVPAMLDQLVASGTDPDPKSRIQSARILKEMLLECQAMQRKSAYNSEP